MIAGKKKNRNDTSMLKEINRKKVIGCIRDKGPLPRVEICEQTGISKPTVTRIIEQMINEGLLVETGSIESERGRHPINVDLVADAKFFVGLNLSKNTLGAAIVDLKMNIVEKELHNIKDVKTSSELISFINNTINSLLKSSGLNTDRILGIGVGVPGLVDRELGIVRNYALANKLRDIPLVDILEKEFSLHTVIDNNCNTRMLGEYYYGFAKGYNDSMFVINSEGVGCSIIQDGNLFKKLNSVSSGFGHMVIDPNGIKCNCGGIGCIETYCSIEQIETRANEFYFSRIVKSCPENEDNQSRINFFDICKSVDEGRTEYVSILVNAASAMACGIVNMINIASPELIILSGVMFDASHFYYNAVIDEVKARIGRDSICPKFVKRSVKDALYEIGAATLIMQESM